MASNFIPKQTQITAEDPEEILSVSVPRVYNVRQCPSCGAVLFGEALGYDAHCFQCGYTAPHSSD